MQHGPPHRIGGQQHQLLLVRSSEPSLARSADSLPAFLLPEFPRGSGRGVGEIALRDGGHAQLTAQGTPHPFVWFGTAESGVDLSAYLPPGYTEVGVNGVNEEGVIVGTASVFNPTTGGTFHAYELIPIPEPRMTRLLGLGALALLLVRIRSCEL